jgi:hypothetical protein
MSYSEAEVSAASTAMNKYRGNEDGEVGAALVVVGLSAERADKEAGIRDDMIRVAHLAGASIRQLSEISGLGRKAVTELVATSHSPD